LAEAPAQGLFKNDPMIAQNFFLEVDGQVLTALMSVTGLDIEVGVMKVTQGGMNGMKQQVKSLGQAVEAPDLQLTRVAPLASGQDALWKWFDSIRKEGMKASGRGDVRKNGSVVLYDSAREEVARFNFYSGWPSKISTDQLSIDGGEAVKETITLVIERLERVK
jgi:phage tail-like protein